jgi:CheY-like chemotaxis protein
VSFCDQSYILIVDDLADNVFLLQTILQLEGYIVDTAFSGQLALSKIQTAPPALVLLDIMMPDMDGWEVLQHIRQNQNLPFIPIILITGCNEISTTQGVESSANGFIRKPFDSDELLEKVSTLLER